MRGSLSEEICHKIKEGSHLCSNFLCHIKEFSYLCSANINILNSKIMTDKVSHICANKQMADLDGEVWKDVIGYEGFYQVSNMGRVKSLDRIIVGKDDRSKHLSERVLKQYNYVRHKNGEKEVTKYMFIRLCSGNVMKNFFVHKLVATAFCTKSKDDTEVNHIDENPANNRADNLEWCTHSENINHGGRNRKVAERTPNRREVDQYTKEGVFIKRHFSISDAARETGIDASQISMCCRRITRCAREFLFCYAGEFNPKPIPAKKVLPEDRKVIQLTMSGEFLAKFDTIADAAKCTNSNPTNIANTMSGLRKSCNGFRWMRNADYIASVSNQKEVPCSDC